MSRETSDKVTIDFKVVSYKFENNNLFIDFDTKFEHLQFIVINSSKSIIDERGLLQYDSNNEIILCKQTSTLRISVSGNAVILIIEKKDHINFKKAFFFSNSQQTNTTSKPTQNDTYESAAALITSLVNSQNAPTLYKSTSEISLKNENISLHFTRKE